MSAVGLREEQPGTNNSKSICGRSVGLYPTSPLRDTFALDSMPMKFSYFLPSADSKPRKLRNSSTQGETDADREAVGAFASDLGLK